MNNLDSLKNIKKYDKDQITESIEMANEQMNQVFAEFNKIKLPKSYHQIGNILLNGMGGSALGAHIIRHLFADQIKVPFEIINSYELPASLSSKTLFIPSSYSGTTEEPLFTIKIAQKKNAKIFGIAGGGKLGQLIKSKKINGYVFEPTFNPSAQPRLGLGYSIGAQIALLKKLGIIRPNPQQIKKTFQAIDLLQAQFGVNNPTSKNLAKKMAINLQGKAPIVVSAEFLAGNAHTFSNQINENAKTFANYHLIPELNHHLLESLKFPQTNKSNLIFVFFESDLYLKKNQIRTNITKNVIQKNKIKYLSYKLKSKDKFTQSMEMLLFGSYVSFYQAILNKVNPSKIPWVDYFKAQLKKFK